MKRILRLHSESLTELTADELGGVVGAADYSLSCPILRCIGTVRECIETRTLNGCVILPTNNCPTLLC